MLNSRRYKAGWMLPLLALPLALSACQSNPSVPPPSPKMPVCLSQVPETDYLSLMIQAGQAFENGSTAMPEPPLFGAEALRLCLISARDAWPK